MSHFFGKILVFAYTICKYDEISVSWTIPRGWIFLTLSCQFLYSFCDSVLIRLATFFHQLYVIAFTDALVSILTGPWIAVIWRCLVLPCSFRFPIFSHVLQCAWKGSNCVYYYCHIHVPQFCISRAISKYLATFFLSFFFFFAFL